MSSNSCLRCAARKVRCDRQKPCSHCKRRRGDICEYPVSVNTLLKSFKTTPFNKVQSERIEQLERYIQSLGHDPNQIAKNGLTNSTIPEEHDMFIDVPTSRTARIGSRNTEKARLVHHDEETTYIETPLWYKWSEATRLANESLEPSQGRNPLGYCTTLIDSINTEEVHILHTRQPPAQVILELWKRYLSNVHPVTKLFFDWGKESVLQKAAHNTQALSKGEQAFSFAIYFITILSLSKDDCEEVMGDSRKPQLLDDFQSYVETALITAGYATTSDLLVLQAFLLYLLALRNRARPATWFSLMGIAVRTATRMGLHRDGDLLSLPPAEAEEKRRVWWQMQHMDIMIALVLGCISMTVYANWDTKLPGNIEDDDVHAGIEVLPTDRHGLTSMSHCLWRYNILYQQRLPTQTDTSAKSLAWITSSQVSMSEKDDFIERTAKLLNENFVQYCEPLNPLHVIIQIGIRSFILAVKRIVYQPEVANTKISEMSKDDREDFLKNSIESLEYYILGETTTSIARFRWHNDYYFQWTAFVYVIIEAHHRASTAEASALWILIDRVCDVHPKLTSTLERPDIVAIGRLIILAWYQRQEHLEKLGQDVQKPRCVVIMEEGLNHYVLDPNAPNPDTIWDADMFATLDFDMINWSSWEKDGYTQVFNFEG